MVEINLYKNYNLTLAEIHQKYAQEHQASKKSSDQGKAAKKPNILIIVGSAVAFLLICSIIIVLVATRKKPAPVQQTVTQRSEPVAHVIDVPRPEYITIQHLEFINEQNENNTTVLPTAINNDNLSNLDNLRNIDKLNSVDKLNNVDNLSINGTLTKSSQNTVVTDKTLKDAHTPSANTAKDQSTVLNTADKSHTVKNPINDTHGAINKKNNTVTANNLDSYSIAIDNLTYPETEIVKKLLEKNKYKVNTVSKGLSKVWTVYMVDKKGDITVNNVAVSPLQTFETRQDAVNFASEKDFDTIIKLTDNANIIYSITACCSSLDTAKDIARDSGITDKIFTIKKD